MSPPLGLYPRHSPRTTNRGEQLVYDALAASLPAGWTAWNSLRIRDDWQEGEGDFVVAIPDRGILVIEVKGGKIHVEDGRWFQNGNPLKMAPRDQGLNYVRKLVARLRRELGDAVPYATVLTCFPQTRFEAEPTADDVRGAVLGAQDLPRLGTSLEKLVDALLDPSKPAPEGVPWREALHELWGHSWVPSMTLGLRAVTREEEMLALDAKQLEVLDMVGETPRMWVTGGPGTGKTILARELYRRWQRAGKNPVYLCSTSALAAGLRGDGLAAAHTVKEYAAALLDAANLELQDGAASTDWTSENWELAPHRAATEALPAVGRSHDAVLVDEGQDLTGNDWKLVTALAGDGPLWIASDEGQAFWPDRGVPEGLVPGRLKLNRQYRCPEGLAAFADTFRSDVDSSRLDQLAAGLGENELTLVPLASLEDLEENLAGIVSVLCQQQVDPQDIAVLSLAGRDRSSLAALTKLGEHDARRADDPDARDRVVVDTFLRFKGLDRAFCIVTELERVDRRRDVRLHIALTRATVGVFVVALRDTLAADPRFAAVLEK